MARPLLGDPTWSAGPTRRRRGSASSSALRTSPLTTVAAGLTRFALCATALVALQGCASTLVAMSGFLSPEEARTYAGLAPYEFVKKRFYTEAQGGVLTSIADGLEAVNKAIPGGSSTQRPGSERRRPEFDDDQALVTWPAYFTDQNYLQLLRPKGDLMRYCEAQGGKLKVLGVDSSDPLRFVRRNPSVAFAEAHAETFRSLAAQGAYGGYAEIQDKMATVVGEQMAIEAQAFNRAAEGWFSIKGYQAAQKLQGFGTFQCEGADGAKWAASILSTTLHAQQAASSMSRLAIRIYRPVAGRKAG
jgi:hypothetical protein